MRSANSRLVRSVAGTTADVAIAALRSAILRHDVRIVGVIR